MPVPLHYNGAPFLRSGVPIFGELDCNCCGGYTECGDGTSGDLQDFLASLTQVDLDIDRSNTCPASGTITGCDTNMSGTFLLTPGGQTGCQAPGTPAGTAFIWSNYPTSGASGCSPGQTVYEEYAIYFGCIDVDDPEVDGLYVNLYGRVGGLLPCQHLAQKYLPFPVSQAAILDGTWTTFTTGIPCGINSASWQAS
jgi:hypothetical protein